MRTLSGESELGANLAEGQTFLVLEADYFVSKLSNGCHFLVSLIRFDVSIFAPSGMDGKPGNAAMVDQQSERDGDKPIASGGDVFQVSRTEDGPESAWPAWPVTVAMSSGGQLTVAMGQYLPTGPASDEHGVAPEQRLLVSAEAGAPVDVKNALKDLYEKALPVWISIPVTERLMKVYVQLREQGAPVDPLPPADETRNASPTLFVQRWLRGCVFAMNPARVAASILARYVVSTWQDASGKTGESIEEWLNRGAADRLSLDTLASEDFARRTEPLLVEQIWEMATFAVEGLQLRRASPRNLEQLLGLRPVVWDKLFAYRDAGPAPDTAHTA